MNNENQSQDGNMNLNNGIGVVPTNSVNGIENIGGQQSVTPVGNGVVTPANPMNNMENLGVQQNVAPAVNGTGMVAPSNPAPQVVSSNPMNTGMNLAPEGVIAPVNPEPAQSQAPVVEPLMGTTLTSETVMNSAPMNAGQVPQAPMGQIPNMGMTPPPNNGMMGGVPVPPAMPPANEKKNPNKKISTPLLIILIVVLIAAIGFGVYYFLFMGKSKTKGVTITPILSGELELGTPILIDSAASFVKVTGMNSSECKVDTNLDSSKVDVYTYTITCGSKTYGPQEIRVKDTTSPKMTLGEVTIAPNTDVSPDAFVDDLEDASLCTLEFGDEMKSIDMSKPGEYKISIIAKDEYGNESKEETTLIIDAEAPVEYLNCEKTLEASQDYPNATVFANYKYGINEAGNIRDIRKITSYVFKTEEDFKTANEDAERNQFDGLKGRVKTDVKRKMISVTEIVTESDLSKEFKLTPFPKTSIEMEEYHQSKDEMCYIDIE